MWLRACIVFLMWHPSPPRIGDQQESSAVWGAPFLLQEKLLEEGLSIGTKNIAIAQELPWSYTSAPTFPPILWWFCSSSPAPLIHMVLVAAVPPANTTWPAQARESIILRYGAAWDCSACWLYISKSIIAFAHIVQKLRVVATCFSSEKTRRKKSTENTPQASVASAWHFFQIQVLLGLVYWDLRSPSQLKSSICVWDFICLPLLALGPSIPFNFSAFFLPF